MPCSLLLVRNTHAAVYKDERLDTAVVPHKNDDLKASVDWEDDAMVGVDGFNAVCIGNVCIEVLQLALRELLAGVSMALWEPGVEVHSKTLLCCYNECNFTEAGLQAIFY